MYKPMNEETKQMLISAEQFEVNGEIDLSMVESLDKDLKRKILEVSSVPISEVKTLVKQFYQIQDQRKALSEQIRSIENIYNSPKDDESMFGRTKEGKAPSNPAAKDNNVSLQILYYVLKNMTIIENNIKKALELVVNSSEVGRWLVQITGIGPILAAGLIANFDVRGKQYSSQFISYAGLNDNNRPWLGKEKSTQIVNEVIGNSKDITDEMVTEISIRTQWKYSYLVSNAYDEKKQKWSKANLIKACSKIPYNADVKKLMFLVGSSFQWKCNSEKSKYGMIFSERRALETKKNENGEYAEYAKKMLSEKNYDKSTETYKCLSQGKLSKAHIIMRSLRYTEKIFLSHLFEEMYRVEYDKIPPRYYALEHIQGEHNKEIEPEVPYTKVSSEK